jgi:hypothetical protein
MPRQLMYMTRESKVKAFTFCTLMLIVIYLSCDGDHDENHYDYIAASYIDTVLMGDTLHSGKNVTVVYFYPYGCNSFEKIECTESLDTLLLVALHRFRFEGMPCAHGSGLDTTQSPLCASGSGSYVVSYTKNGPTQKHIPVFIK